jgi:hypothetical protein
MAYTVSDIAELVHYHLVLSQERCEDSDADLSLLIERIAGMMSCTQVRKPVQWLFCDRCGCSVDVEVLATDGSNFTAHGDFLCSTCLYPEGER